MFIQVKCPCGRTLRAQSEQAGHVIQCWSCKNDVPVPHPDVTSRLVGVMLDSVRYLLQSPEFGVILSGAAVITAAFMIPRVGALLALGLIAVSVRGYGALMGVHVETTTTSTPEGDRDPHEPLVISVAHPAPDAKQEVEPPPGWAGLARGLVAVLAVLALVAPFLVRNRGYILPPVGTTSGVLRWTLLALTGWFVMPVALVAAYAEDRHGPLSPALALRALARHPLLVLAALLIVPLGLVATEGLLALFVWEQGELPLMVADLFPPPQLDWKTNGLHAFFDFDGTQLDKNLSATSSTVVPVYPYAVRRGFTLIGTIPPSLSVGLLEVRMVPWQFEVVPLAYLLTRVILTAVILSVAGVLFAIQAHWLGAVAALDSRRPLARTPH